MGNHFTDGMPPEDGLKTQRIFDDALSHGSPVHSLVSTNRHKDGRTVMLETSAVPFYDKEWNIQGYRGISRDITDRVTAEKQLEFERNLFRSFMEHAPDLIYFKDRDGRFLLCNPAQASFYGMTPQELRGRLLSEVAEPEYVEETIRRDNEILETGAPLLGFEDTSFDKHGQLSTWYTTKVPLCHEYLLLPFVDHPFSMEINACQKLQLHIHHHLEYLRHVLQEIQTLL